MQRDTFGGDDAAYVGTDKGSVMVKGLAPGYGGSVTYKFDIVRKDLKYGSRFTAGNGLFDTMD